MKRLLLIIALTVTATFVYGQKSIDALFEKYAGKDGFVTITINGNLLDLARCLDDDDDDDALPLNITEIRLLVQDDDNMKVDNFYDMVIKGINTDNYEEFMRIKESDQDLRMLVRAYAETMKILMEVSTKLNRGTRALEPVSKMNEQTFKSFDAINKSTNIIEKNFKSFDYLQKALELSNRPEK